MQEIIFRGKRVDNREWIEGGYCICDGKTYIITFIRYMPDTRDWDEADYYENNKIYKNNLLEVIPETVGQYTGFQDENKVKIFEGDEITATWRAMREPNKIYKGVVAYCVGWCAYKICKKYNEIGEVLNEYRCEGMGYEKYSKFEVIGNIHDKEELKCN